MATEKEKVLKMLEDGKVTPEDATRLLQALGEEPDKRTGETRNIDLKGKKLRIKVQGDMEDARNLNVDVAVPLALAKLADGIVANVVPKDVNKGLEDQGINLKGLNLGELVEHLSDLDEDLVNVSVDTDEGPIKVRVYVE